MGDIVNLQQYRKKLKREQAERRAAGNRMHFGRGKLERRGTDNARQRHERNLDSKQLQRPGDDESPSDRQR